jgi:hypothetical protein
VMELEERRRGPPPAAGGEGAVDRGCSRARRISADGERCLGKLGEDEMQGGTGGR